MSYLLEVKDIVKDFPGVRALDGVSFGVNTGEIHALVGENGAGKSTLMKILSGVYPDGSYGGQVLVDGGEVRFDGIRAAERAGIAIIHQEFALVRQLSVAENILLGGELHSGGVIRREASLAEAEAALKLVGLEINPEIAVGRLGVGYQQLVEIAKALRKNVRVLILDEPTAALSEDESRNLLAIIKGLAARGVACIYISHRLGEVLELAHRITVLRDGRTVSTEEKTAMTEASIVTRMVGRELSGVFPEKESGTGNDLFEVSGWTAEDPASGMRVEDISFKVRRGEVLGIAGLVGSGRTELAMSLFGAWGPGLAGSVRLDGKELGITSPRDAIAAGLGLVSEDRKKFGLVLPSDITTNVTLASLDKVAARGVIDENAEILAAVSYIRDLKIKTPSPEQRAVNLSGGNQQKVVLSKWLMTAPRVLILDEPTRGIDIGAKFEIYGIIDRLARGGMGIIVISSELPEVLGLAHRILVMRSGRVSGELDGKTATQEKIMTLAACA
ncbi:MAG: D-xylose ABC transporter ATP-binding protein [Elusimicrobia bacterium RIFOXYA12_FULL_57_11]|nr:MAG: D-xylose ABC transporter ATP-binding protein [Elusimicrobia bacterium RIFOXYA12_FULL_57_11]